MAQIQLDRLDGQPLPHQLAAHVQALIDKGTLSPGTRVPSVREASQLYGVSPGTVVEAYQLLQDRGRIEARPQSGFFVRDLPIRSVNEPRPTRPKLRAHAIPQGLAERMHQQVHRGGMVGLGFALPDPALMPSQLLGRHLQRCMREHPVRSIAYGPPEGTIELRTEVARRMLDAGCTIDPEEIVITSGATEAMYLSLKAVTKPGDVVAVESPTYHGILDVLCALGLKALPISTCSTDGISVSELERALSTRSVAAIAIVANFTNPIGGCLSTADRERVVELARLHQATIIEDDVYGDLAYDGCHPPAVRSFDDGSSVMYCSSFSKTLAAGFRVGWCIPGAAHSEVVRLKRKLNVGTAVPQQLAIAGYLASGKYSRHIRGVQRAYMERVGRMIDHVSYSFPEGTRISQPLGGSVIWVELPGEFDALRLFEDAESVGISIAPGPLFAVDGAYQNCIRLNCANPWSPEIASAVTRLGILLDEQKEKKSSGRVRAKRARPRM